MTVFARIGVRGAALAVLAGVIVLLARGGLVPFVGLAHAEDAPARPAMPAATVTSFVATLEPWVSRIEVTGSVRAERQIELAPEEPGTVAAVRFDSGQDVASGALLVQLDDSVDRAEVTRLEAERALARTTLDREERLARTDATSHAALDQARATFAAADAALETQRARLAKKSLRAPFAGQLGIRHVDVGQYVSPGTALVTLQALDALFVDFAVPQRHLPSLRIGARVAVLVDAHPAKDFAGTVEAIEPRASEATRSFEVRARLPNDERLLRPGMFARVRLETGSGRDSVTIPQAAVVFNPFGDYVYRIEGERDDALVAKQVYVRTGERRGDQVEVVDGLAAGDRVVSTGQTKLRDGAPVQIDDSIQPDNDPDPRPPSGSGAGA